jgi:polar amino acid transport system substrate-binding protein
VAIHGGSPWTLQDFLGVNLTVGAQRGTTDQYWVEDTLIGPGRMPVDQLILYELDTAGNHRSPERGYRWGHHLHPGSCAPPFREKPLYILGELETNERYGVVGRKEDTELLSTLNNGLTRLMNDPYWNTFIQKYERR